MQTSYQKYVGSSKIILLSIISLISFNSLAATAPSNEYPPTWQQLGLMDGFPPSANKLVTKANFRKPPYNRWAFQRMRYLNFTAPIERGTTGVVPFETQPQDLMNKKFNINNHSQSLVNFAKQSYTDAVIVLYKGKIITEYYTDGMTEQTPHWLASMTKSVTGTLADLMVHRGLLDPNKKITFYIPELQKSSAYKDATVQQVLDMEIAVVAEGNFEAARKPNSYANKFAMVNGFLPAYADLSNYEVLPQVESTGQNGKKFLYSSPNTEVAGWLISRVANKPLEVLLSQEIWSKLGTSGEAYTIVDPHSKMFSAGGLNFTTRDMARFGQMIANNGQFNNQQILPAEVIKSITGGGNKLSWKNGEYRELIPNLNSYHSFWYQTDNKNHAVMAMGIHGQHMYIDPVNNVVIVKFASYPTQFVDAYDDGWTAVYPQIVAALVGG